MTNVFFNNYQSASEQELLHSLVAESISIHGIDVFYIPRNLNNFDAVYNADDISSFTRAITTEVYVKSVDGFEGDQNFMSKFGLEIRDRVTFTIATKTFEKDVGGDTNFTRPREGDVIYFPLNKKCFDIKFVDNKPFFYSLGTLPSYDLYCELFEYSNERFITGIPEIDSIQEKLSTDILDYAILDDTGKALVTDTGDTLVTDKYNLEEIDILQDNHDIQVRADGIIDFSNSNPFSESSKY